MTTDAVGGVWRYTMDLARGATAAGQRVRLAVIGPRTSASQRAEADAIQVDLVETGLALDWTALDPETLADTTAKLRALAVGTASVHLHAPALAGTATWPVPVVAVCHSCVGTWWRAVHVGALPEDLAWRAQATAAGLACADRVVAPTAAHAQAMRDAYGGVGAEVIHNGSDMAPVGSRSRRGILTAGRLWDEAKNAAALDRAAADGLDIAAAGPIEGPNGATIHLARLQLLGPLGRADMARAFASARVFASLALYEPFGLAVLEAARCGLRLVLSDIPSFRELWDGAATFVPPGSDPAPALRAALAAPGDGGAAAHASRYAVDTMVERTLSLHAGLRAG